MSSRADAYTHLRAHETRGNLVCRLLLEKKKLADYIKANYDRNSMVRAIKYCREQTGWGLKESKEYVEKCILN